VTTNSSNSQANGTAPLIPGEWLLAADPIEINASRRKLRLPVRNTGDRPIQVGSHFHFFEVNRVLDFDRAAALGMRLDVPSGQSIRFEAGDEREVELVAFGGHGRVIGFNNLLDAATSGRESSARALRRAVARGFSGAEAGRDAS
jgi:urease subunit beta/urease subunit gamma/beta